ncbi:rhodopsin, GQ-coupled-like [Strongylocentrotus purpuratus]|uniref:G-protein coupled receptors family 1 profile domain-containing protein n=1 Tax=Strongylocentrotus purpuratus TaxID=7668 RepID=A0A7M7N732_STRPU|nr:rhodopsin, GQ-coupled-like [Strongylocentrotus purpuratus]
MSATESAAGTESWDHIHPIPAAWFLVVCTVLSISCNTINLTVIPRLNDLADTSKVFYIALAIFDLMVTFIHILMIKPSISGYWIYGELACKAIGTCAGFVLAFSSATVTLLNIDRFILIIRPLRYPSIVTLRRCVAVLVATCCSMVIIGLLEFEFAGHSFDIVRFREFGVCIMDSTDKDFLPIAIFNYTISFWAQAVIITVLYLIVIRTAWKHTNDMARREEAVFQIRKFYNPMLEEAFAHYEEGVSSRQGADLFNDALFKAKTKCTHILVRKLLYVDDIALAAHTQMRSYIMV